MNERIATKEKERDRRMHGKAMQPDRIFKPWKGGALR
jgi:hypothetical protein